MDTDRLQSRERGGAVKLLLGYDREVAEWVANQLGMTSGFGQCSAIGIVRDNAIIAGVVYFNYRPPNIEMAIASTTPKWCTRRVLYHCFNYPFNQLKCKRITVLVDSENQPVRAFDERLGFVHEGTLRQANPNGDAEVYGMLKSECRWLKWAENQGRNRQILTRLQTRNHRPIVKR